MDGNGGPGQPSFRPNYGVIVHFSTSWPPQGLKKSAARPLRRVQISNASALRASAVRPKPPRSRGRRLFSTLSATQCLVMCGGTDADGCTVSTMEPEHSVLSEGDVAVAVALGGRELR